jgi:hypothetical protein
LVSSSSAAGAFNETGEAELAHEFGGVDAGDSLLGRDSSVRDRGSLAAFEGDSEQTSESGFFACQEMH